MIAAPHWIAALLLLGVLCGPWWGSGRQRLLRALLAGSSAVLLWLALFPPQRPTAPTDLLLLTAHAPPELALQRIAAGARVLALPEAPPLEGVTQVRDLAAALRQVPQARSVEILGAGLVARDQGTPIPTLLHYTPPAQAAPAGAVLHWSMPQQVPAGAPWTLQGQLAADAPTRLRLLDPAGTTVAQGSTDAEGHFSLQTQARTAGQYLYRLQVLDQTRELHALELPLQVHAGSAPRVLLLAGAPSPELKYLRRWASDAGVVMHSRMALGLNMQIGSARAPLDVEGWSEWDLLLLDERSLAALGQSGRSALLAAMQEGLGVLLRLTAPLGDTEAQWLAQLHMRPQPAPLQTRVDWPIPGAQPDQAALQIQLNRRPLQIDGDLVQPLLRTAEGAVLGAWRPLQQGRLGVLWLTDSYRLQLHGQGAAHAALWQQLFSTLARPVQSDPAPQLISPAPWRVEQRVVWCGLDPARRYQLHASDHVQQLLPDPAQADCAAAWPAQPGWQQLRDDKGGQWTLYVHPADAAPAQLQRQQQEYTERLAQQSAQRTEPQDLIYAAGPAWPWWLAWLLASALLWWLERRWATPASPAT